MHNELTILKYLHVVKGCRLTRLTLNTNNCQGASSHYTQVHMNVMLGVSADVCLLFLFL